MTTIQQSMSNTLQLLEQHTENIIRSLAAEHGFDADEAIQKFITSSTSSPTVVLHKKGKGKKIEDPNKPKNPNKKPSNSYFLFMQDKRAEVKEANPDMKPVDITRVLKDMWTKLDKDGLAPYKQKADAAMAVWKQDTATWKESLNND